MKTVDLVKALIDACGWSILLRRPDHRRAAKLLLKPFVDLLVQSTDGEQPLADWSSAVAAHIERESFRGARHDLNKMRTHLVTTR